MHVCTLKYLLRNESRIQEMTDSQTDESPTASRDKKTSTSGSNPDASSVDSAKGSSTPKDSGDGSKTHEKPSEMNEDKITDKDPESVKDETQKISNEEKKGENTDSKENKSETKSSPTKQSRIEQRNKENKFYLEDFKKYVEESLKTPFALGQEKEKPKLKISER